VDQETAAITMITNLVTGLSTYFLGAKNTRVQQENIVDNRYRGLFDSLSRTIEQQEKMFSAKVAALQKENDECYTRWEALRDECASLHNRLAKFEVERG